MAHFYVKTLHSGRATRKLPCPRASPQFWGIYSPWKTKKISFFLLLLEHNLMVHFSLLVADILKNYVVYPVPLGKWSNLPGFFSISLSKWIVSSNINMKIKGSIKLLLCSGLLLPFYELTKLGVLAKQTLKWLLNQEIILIILIIWSCPWELSSFLSSSMGR